MKLLSCLITLVELSNKFELLKSTKWNEISKVVLAKDKRLLEKVLMETNPEYRNKLLDKPLCESNSPKKLKLEKQTSYQK